ncbi:MAG: hypothetical protein AAFO15_01710 [Pseudomonadota bacterium]
MKPVEVVQVFNKDNYYRDINYKPFNNNFIKKSLLNVKTNIGIGGILSPSITQSGEDIAQSNTIKNNKNKLALYIKYPIKIALDFSNTEVGLKVGNILAGRVERNAVYLDNLFFIQGIIQIQQFYINIGYCLIYHNIINTYNNDDDGQKDTMSDNSLSRYDGRELLMLRKPNTENKFFTSLKPYFSCNIYSNISNNVKLNLELGYIKDYGYNIFISIL